MLMKKLLSLKTKQYKGGVLFVWGSFGLVFFKFKAPEITFNKKMKQK